MVATIAAGTQAAYYSKQSEYYLGGGEPAGRWITATNDFGATHGALVDNALFERLHAGLDADGQPLLSNKGDGVNRVGGIDLHAIGAEVGLGHVRAGQSRDAPRDRAGATRCLRSDHRFPQS